MAAKPPTTMAHNALNKFGAACGIISLSLFLLLLPSAGWLPPPSPNQTPEEVVAHYIKHKSGIQGGASLLTMLGITWVFFSATIAGQMSRIPNLPTSIIHAQTIAGAVASVYLTIPAYLMLLATYRLERAPGTTQMLHDLAFMLVVMAVIPFIVQDFAFSYAVLQDRREKPLVPRWMAWVSFVLSMFYWLALGVPMVKSGPMAWNGALAFWVTAVAGFAEYTLISVFMWNAVGRSDIAADGESRVETEGR